MAVKNLFVIPDTREMARAVNNSLMRLVNVEDDEDTTTEGKIKPNLVKSEKPSDDNQKQIKPDDNTGAEKTTENREKE